MQIVDAVVAAHILNAILVVPKLDQKSYWKIQGFIWNNLCTKAFYELSFCLLECTTIHERNHSFFTCSNFSEIFDVDWFISRISKDVKIIRDLPRIGDKIITPYTTRVPRKCNAKCYQTRILPILKKKHVSPLQINGTCLPFPVHQNMISSHDMELCVHHMIRGP